MHVLDTTGHVWHILRIKNNFLLTETWSLEIPRANHKRCYIKFMLYHAFSKLNVGAFVLVKMPPSCPNYSHPGVKHLCRDTGGVYNNNSNNKWMQEAGSKRIQEKTWQRGSYCTLKIMWLIQTRESWKMVWAHTKWGNWIRWCKDTLGF